MISSRLPKILAALLAAAFALPLSGQQARLLAPGQVYGEGARLSSPTTGITFVVTNGYRGQWDPQIGGLLLESASGTAIGVWAWSEGSMADAVELVGTRLEAQGIYLSPTGEPILDANRFQATFSAMTAEGAAVLHGAGRVGPQGNPLVVAGLGSAADADAIKTAVEAVLSSVSWAPPTAGAWRSEVAGTSLHWNGSSSDISTGTTTATGASQSTATLTLCSGRGYAYEESSESYVSIEGASASSSSSDGHQGEWWLIADLAGQATLFLESNDGRAFEWSVEESGEGFLIDGYFYRAQGAMC